MADANPEQDPRPEQHPGGAGLPDDASGDSSPATPDSTPDPADTPENDGRMTPEDYSPESSGYDVESGYYDGYQPDQTAVAESPAPAAEPAAATPPPPPPASGGTKDPEPEQGDEEDDGMLRMSFMEHLEELRLRIIRALGGIAAAFAVCIFFSNEIWDAVRQPAANALKQLGFPGELAQITPTEAFSIIWIKLPVLAALFLAAPWVLYQVWAFIAPGLYKKERRLAAPFIITTAGLFILGGCFAYFVAFRFGLTFLLGIGVNIGVRPIISMTEYTDLFINVMLGVGLVFELPVLIFFLTLLRIASPRFLLRNSRYAILLIVVGAAIITPTPDVYNLTIFAVPMILLYFIGVFASYLLVLSREGRRFPWGKVLIWLAVIAAILAAAGYMAMSVYGLKFIPAWPFLAR
jgi:sec-independent protein translocase protein TatC